MYIRPPDRSTLRDPFMLKLLTALLAFSSPTHATEKKTDQQYWEETGLSREQLHEFIDDQYCHADSDNFRACVAALTSLGSQSEPALSLVPSALAGDADIGFGPAVKSFGALSFVTVKSKEKSDESLRVVMTRNKANRQRLTAALNELFAQQNGMQVIAFNAIRSHIEAAVLSDRSKEAMFVAAALTAAFHEAGDPHAHLSPTQSVEDSTNNANDDFVGIGAELQSVGGKTVVQTPMEGSPAIAAGIRASDVIVKVDGIAIEGMDLSKVVEKIRGPEGTTVRLRVSRAGQELDFAIVRGKIVQANVVTKLVKRGNRQIAKIKLRTFMDRNACSVIGKKLAELESSVDGIILDVRGNGGGLLDQANCIGGLFVGKETIVLVKNLQANTFQRMRSGQEQVTAKPMVVLINAGSASASEIIAGALQDHKRAWIVGERSFGKGTVQSPDPFLGNEKILFYQTIQRFYQPNGRTNQVAGILPNFEVPVKPGATEDERFALRIEDLFPNALSAVGPPWKDPRAAQVAEMQGCVSRGQAKALYEQGKNEAIAPDYQALVAEDVLSCETR